MAVELYFSAQALDSIHIEKQNQILRKPLHERLNVTAYKGI